MRGEPDDELWSAIADPSRKRVLDLLVRRGDSTASSLAEHVPFSRQAVAKHLTILERAGLITRRKEGREVLFHVDPARLDAATQALVAQAQEWDRRLHTIKRLAEQVYKESQAEPKPPIAGSEPETV